MRGTLRWFGVFVALALTVASGGANAQGGPEKLYALKLEILSPTGPTFGDGLTLKATFRNISPKNANSSFNALRLVAPDSVSILTAPAGCTLVTPKIIRCENLSPVGKDAEYPLTFTANVGPTACGARWNPDPDDDVWTGSNVGSGNPFALRPYPAPPATATYTASLPSTTPTVTVVFSDLQSGGAVIGAPYSGTATVTNSCGAPASNVSVTTSITPSGSTLTAPSGNTTNGSGIFGFTANFAAGSTGTVSVTALGVTGSASVGLYGGTLACQTQIPLSVTNPGNKAMDEPGWSASERLLWNTNGASCELVPYTYTNALLTDGSVVLRWPTQSTSSQMAALFRNSANGPAKTLPATTAAYPTPVQPLYGWQFNADGTPTYLTGGLACLSGENPRPYARLGTGGLPASAGAGTQFSVESSGTLVEPGTGITDTNGWKPLPAAGVQFDVNVDNERIRVTVVSGTTLEVVERNRGSTVLAGHAAGAFVIPAVMPIDARQTTPVYQYVGGVVTQTGTSNPYYNTVVRMCTIAHGIQVWKPDAAGVSKYYEFLEYFDGDGWVRVGF